MGHLQGFATEQQDETYVYSMNIGINMTINHTFILIFKISMVYGGIIIYAKQANASRLSRLFNVGFIVDGYNGIRYNAKNKQLVYLSLGLSALGTSLILHFY